MYYVVRVRYLYDGTEKKSELMSYESKQQALSKFHTNMGTDMADPTLKGSMCTVLNEIAGQEAAASWEVEEPEPNEE